MRRHHQRYNFTERVGIRTIRFCRYSLKVVEFCGNIALASKEMLLYPRREYLHRLNEECYNFGPSLILAIILTSLVFSHLLSLIIATNLKSLGLEVHISAQVLLTNLRRVTPLVTSLIILLRASTLELRVIQPLHGYYFHTHPIVIRALAAVLIAPMLCLWSDLASIYASLFALKQVGIPITFYTNQIRQLLTFSDVAIGLMKSSITAGFVTVISCYYHQWHKMASARLTVIYSVITSVIWIILIDLTFETLLKQLNT